MIEDVYPLSPLQEGIYFHWLHSPEATIYFEQYSYGLKGALQIEELKESFRVLVSRHAILRTFFTHELAEEVLQAVKKEVDVTLNYIDASQNPEFSLKEFRELDRGTPFDLNKVSPLRLSLIRLDDNVYEFVWSFHHILMDGWCLRLLLQEFFYIYSCNVHNEKPILKKAYPYVNYIKWLENVNQDTSIQYWKNYLSGYENTNLFNRSVGHKTSLDNDLKSEKLEISGQLKNNIMTLCADLEITENIFFQSIWSVLLKIFSNSDDTLFGAVVSGRPPEISGIEDMIGLFINTIPVRVRFSQNMTFEQLVKEIKDDFVKGINHHYTALSQIQSNTGVGKEFIDHIMVFENYPDQDVAFKDNPIELLSTEVFEQTNYDLSIIIHPGKVFDINFAYNGNAYKTSFIKQIKYYFERLIPSVIENPSLPLYRLEYLGAEERRELLETFNDTAADYPRERTIIDLFGEQVDKRPEGTALVFGDKRITYQELNESSNRMARYLRDRHGIGKEDMVGICLERSDWVVVCILGILKAGGAYVPIDPDYPEDRIGYMLEDSACKVLIDSDELSLCREELDSLSGENLPSVIGPKNLAYVIYTSGSTGKPKGVMVEHRSVNKLAIAPNYVSLSEDSCILSFSDFSFDGSIFDIFGTLLNGKKLVITPKKTFLDFHEVNRVIEQHNVSIFFLTTALFNAMVDSNLMKLSRVKDILFGGERVSLDHVAQFKLQYPHINLVHVYGPTEGTTFSSYKQVLTIDEELNTIPIGSPISNTRIYILGMGDSLCPIGVVGEICISGDGLARGYLNSPGLSSEKFVSNPYSEGDLMYRTGDLGRWLVDGTIEFMGR
ncbi:non-ribosomal peptide synthetase, partial [Spongiimicrobium salis]|uniref:non-ribosomal peptide synthetase n=1 Tax=Spongiimicrobium salis TaxID=1667022 RepID=UPI00374DFB2A